MKNTPNSLNMTLTSPNCGVVMVKSGFERLSSAAVNPSTEECTAQTS